MTKLNKEHSKTQWLKIIDQFGEDAINAQLWHTTFANARKYFENRMPMSTEQRRTASTPARLSQK